MCGIVSHVSDNWYFEVSETYICGHICVTSLLLCICSHNPWVLFSDVGVGFWMSPSATRSSARCSRWPVFALIGISCRCVIDVSCWTVWFCTRLIRTRLTDCSVSYPSVSIRVRIPELRVHLMHWSLKYEGVERPNLQGVTCRPRFVREMTFPTQYLAPEHW